MSGRPPPNRDRAFGYGVGTVLVLLASWLLLRQRQAPAWWCGAIGALLLVLSWIAPAWLRIPSSLWWRLAHILGWINTRVLLSALFVLMLTPLGLVMRLAGWDPLRRHARAGTNWNPLSPPQRGSTHYERMY